MPKAYWIGQYSEVHDPDKLAAYAVLAGPAIEAAGGRFLARGVAAYAFESGKLERTVVIEFANVDNEYSITAIDWAYNSVAGAPIAAGQSGSIGFSIDDEVPRPGECGVN